MHIHWQTSKNVPAKSMFHCKSIKNGMSYIISDDNCRLGIFCSFLFTVFALNTKMTHTHIFPSFVIRIIWLYFFHIKIIKNWIQKSKHSIKHIPTESENKIKWKSKSSFICMQAPSTQLLPFQCAVMVNEDWLMLYPNIQELDFFVFTSHNGATSSNFVDLV